LEENGGQTVVMKCEAAAVHLCARVRGRREEEREREEEEARASSILSLIAPTRLT
jgi:hypothetical protein